MKRLVLALLVSLSLLSCSKQPAPPATVGNPAPDFALKDEVGREVRLSSLKGNVVLVNFWATWCPPCREEIPSLAKLNQTMAGKPFRLLAISIDERGPDAVDRLYKQMGVSLPTLYDSDGAVSKRYGTTGVPETFVVDTKGIIVNKVIGGIDWADPRNVQALQGLMGK